METDCRCAACGKRSGKRFCNNECAFAFTQHKPRPTARGLGETSLAYSQAKAVLVCSMAGPSSIKAAW